MKLLLIQIRNIEDPMRFQEVAAFARATALPAEHIVPFDLLSNRFTIDSARGFDAVLIGGSGDYSVTSNESWLHQALDGLRRLCETKIPVFASCWGFQAIARALGGRVERDETRAEVGCLEVSRTDAAREDPVFCQLPERFFANMGHMDHVVELPPGAIRLATTARSTNQAYTLSGQILYATQFHPELTRDDLLERLRQYPEYIHGVTGKSFEAFQSQLCDTPECNTLLRRFLECIPRK